MPKPLRLRPEAIAEAREAREWYEERSEAAAIGFLESLNDALNQIEQRPGSHPVYDDPLRVVVLKKYPYTVLYRELDKETEVVAIAHGRRKPGYWNDRLQN
ncbi:MAG: type II toxin-antitoxin system RelE/ParE family toxin [Planctomycetaceae bacterium]|nr:type II toxin-antitoxin system RelE/ParE family toxin [Planctomycetaceae bacterium]